MIDKNWEPEFKERLEKNYDELKWLYSEIYNNNQEAFDYFCTMLHDYYEQRSPLLKEWDEARLAVPDWYRGNDMMGELMYTQCFNETLNGIKDKLDYLKETHINYLHLMPLFDSVKGKDDGGYAVKDFRKVREDLGTMEDLASLAEECHANGISVCLDFVMNHTSEDHEWAVRARNGEAEYMNRYFFFDNWNIPNEFEKTVPQVFPQTAPGNFSWCDALNKVVMTTFYPYQWDLNYANPTVFNDMTANMLYLCNQGVDILRLDAVPYIWKKLGTTCRNLPEVHTLVRIMHIASDIVCPGTLLLGEVVMEPSKVVPYFGSVEKPECHMLYNVTTMCTMWNTVATKDVRLLRHQMESVFALPKQYTFLNYLRCHDDIGWGLDFDFLGQWGINEVSHKKYLNDYLKGALWESNARGELYNDDPRLGDARMCGTTASLCGVEAADFEMNDFKMKMALDLDVTLHAFLFTQSGIPVLYSGDEIGQLNDYSYHDDPDKWDDSRYLHRGKLNWDHVALRNNMKTRQGKLFAAIKKLQELRAGYDVFDSNADTWIVEPYNDHILGIGRYYKDQKLIALFNFADDEQTAWINEEESYIDLMSGEPMEAKAVKLAAHGFVWLLTSYKDTSKSTQAPDVEAVKREAALRAKKEAEEASKAAKEATKKAEEKAKEAKKAAAEALKVAKEEEAKRTAAKKAKEMKAKREAVEKAEEKKAEVKKAPAKKAPAKKAAAKKPATKKTAKAATKKTPVKKSKKG